MLKSTCLNRVLSVQYNKIFYTWVDWHELHTRISERREGILYRNSLCRELREQSSLLPSERRVIVARVSPQWDLLEIPSNLTAI